MRNPPLMSPPILSGVFNLVGWRAVGGPDAWNCVVVCLVARPALALAEPCPGNPDALGTSRVLTISPAEFSALAACNIRHTLPLNDHEVVITFDDGPIPPYSNAILDTLASQCVKATYFLVGEMAQLIHRSCGVFTTPAIRSAPIVKSSLRLPAADPAEIRTPDRPRHCIG